MRLPQITALLLALLLTAATTQAGLPLDRLSNCAGLSRIHQILRSDPTNLGPCRASKGPAEKIVLEGLGTGFAKRLCFFESDHFSLFKGYSCLRSKDGIPSVTCFLPAKLEDISDFNKTAHSKYAADVSDYLQRAAACDVSNGDSTASGPSLLPWLIRPAAAYDSGFVVSFGVRNTRKADGVAHHGFAIAKDRLARSGTPAIEFLDIYLSRPVTNSADQTERQIVRDWVLTVDDAPDADKQFSRQLTSQGARAVANFTTWEFLSRTPSEIPYQTKLLQLNRWQDILVAALEQQGFDEYTEISASQKADLTRRLRSEQSKLWGDLGLHSHDRFMIFRNKYDPACARHGGLMIAVVAGMQPDRTSDSSFGSVDLMIAGTDRCGSVQPTEAFVTQTIDLAKAQVRKELNSP